METWKLATGKRKWWNTLEKQRRIPALYFPLKVLRHELICVKDVPVEKNRSGSHFVIAQTIAARSHRLMAWSITASLPFRKPDQSKTNQQSRTARSTIAVIYSRARIKAHPLFKCPDRAFSKQLLRKKENFNSNSWLTIKRFVRGDAWHGILTWLQF